MGFNMRERLREGEHEVIGYDPRPEVTDVPTLPALAEALTTFHESLAISQRLAATDPSNAGWQRELAVAQHRLGRVFQKMGDEKQAQSSFRSAVKTMARAAKMSPENAGWKIDLNNMKSWLRLAP